MTRDDDLLDILLMQMQHTSNDFFCWPTYSYASLFYCCIVLHSSIVVPLE